MKTKARFVLILTLALLTGAALSATLTQAAPGAAPLAQGGAPAVVSYQGLVRVNSNPYTGNGFFKFAIVNAAGDVSYWSNDGSGTGGGEPTTAVELAVSDGLFSILLGDTTLGGMTQPLAADVFNLPDRYLRVWFSSDNSTFDQLTPDTRIAAVPYALQAQEAVDADTVDGLHAIELETHYQNVVVVAKSGGDFTGVQAAIDSISDAATDNPYLVWVAPGVYSETVTMKPYVHLQGAGQEATVITSTASNSVWPPVEATLVLASDVSLRDLTLGNSGAGDSNVALLATAGMTRTLVADVTARALGGGASNLTIVLSGSGTDVTLQQVTALAENGSNSNIGLFNHSGAAVLLHGGIFTGRGGANAYGILNRDGDATLDGENVTALGENSSGLNCGLYNIDSAVAVLRGGVFTGRGGNQTGGVANQQNSTLTAEDVTTLAENGIENYSLGNYDNAVLTVRGAAVTARGGESNYALSNEFNSTMDAESVNALAEDGSSANYGLWNVNNGHVTVRGGSFTGSGGPDAWGIYNHNSGTTLDADSVTALGENGSNNNYGLLIYDGAAAMLRGGSFTGSGGTDAFGIFNLNSAATLEAESVTVLAENGSERNFGLYNYGGAEATLSGGYFTGRGGLETRGIENADSGSTLTAEGVTALGENGSNDNYGLGSYDSATTTTRCGTFIGRGGTDAYGIANGANSATLEAESVTALAENGSDDNYGLHNFSGAATTLRGGSFTGRGGTYAYGIYSIDSGTTLEAESVTALGEIGSSTSYGLFNDSSATATANSSQFIGSSNGLYLASGTVSLGVSQLDGSATRISGTLTCFQVYNGSYVGYTCP